MRGEHNRLGYAVQLTSLRYPGAFPDDFSILPQEVLQTLIKQLDIHDPTCILLYVETRQRRRHAVDIQTRYYQKGDGSIFKSIPLLFTAGFRPGLRAGNEQKFSPPFN